MSSMLTSSNPVKIPCGRPKCTLCPEGGKQIGRCYTRNVVYASECTLCPEGSMEGRYIGETSRSLLERNKEHQDDQKFEVSSTKSHRREHLQTSHPDVDPKDISLFKVKILRTHPTAMSRMIHESMLVRQGEGVLLNSKEEYSRTLMPCLRLEGNRNPSTTPQAPPPQVLHQVGVGHQADRRPAPPAVLDHVRPAKRLKTQV